MKRAAFCILGVFAFNLTLAFSGCSFLLGIAGSEIDYVNQGGPDVDDPRDVGKLKTGQLVIVTRQNGDTLQGAYLGLFARSSQEYSDALDSATLTLGGSVSLPRLGDKVKVVTESEGVTSALYGTFEGFDPSCLYIMAQGSTQRQLLPEATIVSVIDTSRHVIQGEAIRKWLSQGKLPCVSSMRLARADGMVDIPMEDIKGITNAIHSNVGAIGIAVGAVFDISIIVVAMANHFGPSPGSY